MTRIYCKFRTNIDCCKRYMPNISGLSIAPNVGDHVTVYRDDSLELQLKVVERTWELIYSDDIHLVCELHLPDHIPTIERLEKIIKEQ